MNINSLIKKTKLNLYSSVRYSAMGISFLNTIMMLKVLNTQDFVSFQVMLSLVVILYWFIDLGSIDLVILAKDDRLQISKYSSGRTFRYIVLTFLVFFVLYFFHDPRLALIFMATNADYFNDSMITYRSVRNSLSYLTITLLVRKCVPLLFLVYLSVSNIDNTFESFLLITFFSNIPWIIRDFIALPFSMKDVFFTDSATRLNSLQQGGNFLQNLDIPLLNYLSFSVIIPPYVLGKKLFQIGSVFGQFQVPRIMDMNINDKNLPAIRKDIFYNFRLSIILTLTVIFFTELATQEISLINLSSEDRIFAYVCLLICNLSILTTQQNSALKALQNFRILMVSTLTSTSIYLFSIAILISTWQQKWLLLLSVLLNLGIELLFQKTALDKSIDNE